MQIIGLGPPFMILNSYTLSWDVLLCLPAYHFHYNIQVMANLGCLLGISMRNYPNQKI